MDYLTFFFHYQKEFIQFFLRKILQFYFIIQYYNNFLFLTRALRKSAGGG